MLDNHLVNILDKNDCPRLARQALGNWHWHKNDLSAFSPAAAFLGLYRYYQSIQPFSPPERNLRGNIIERQDAADRVLGFGPFSSRYAYDFGPFSNAAWSQYDTDQDAS
jgi:hypothetical protein